MEDEPMEICVASFESRNFSFEAYGRNEGEAREAFAKGLAEHKRQCGVDDGWVAEVLEELEVRRVVLGVLYRDREPLVAVRTRAPAHERGGLEP